MTDGISSRFDLADFTDLEPTALAEALVRQYHKFHDDAFAMVAKLSITRAA
jgi:hypothetical protein